MCKMCAKVEMEPQDLLGSKDVLGMQRFLESQLYQHVECAVDNNNAPMIQMLIDRQAVNPFTNVEQFVTNGYRMLIKAIEQKALDAAMQLIKYGVKVHMPIDANSDILSTPLRQCLDLNKEFAEQSCLPVIQALISNGALNGTVENGISVVNDALENAVNLDSSILVNLFIEHGANVDMIENEEGYPLVIWAGKCRQVEAMLALMRKGARLDVTDPDGAGILFNFFNGDYDDYKGPAKDPEKYKLSSEYNYVHIVKELIEAGANPALLDRWNVRPIGALGFGGFSFQEYTQIADILLLHGASLDDIVYDDIVEDNPCNALQLALQNMQYERVKYWLEKGASADYEVDFMKEENINVQFFSFIETSLDEGRNEALIIRIAELFLRWGASMSHILQVTLQHSTREYCEVLWFFLTFCLQNDGDVLAVFLAYLSDFSEDQRALVQDFFQQRKTAFFMADHARLGSASHLRSLPRELLEYIFDDKI